MNNIKYYLKDLLNTSIELGLNNSISSTSSDTGWEGLTTALQKYLFRHNKTYMDESSHRLPLSCATGALYIPLCLWKVDLEALSFALQPDENFKRDLKLIKLFFPKLIKSYRETSA